MFVCGGTRNEYTSYKKKSVQDEWSGLSKTFLHTLISTKYNIHMCEGETKKLLHVLAGHQIIKPYVRMDKGMNVCVNTCVCVCW